MYEKLHSIIVNMPLGFLLPEQCLCVCVWGGFVKLHVTKTDCLKDLKLGVMNSFTLSTSCGVRQSSMRHVPSGHERTRLSTTSYQLDPLPGFLPLPRISLLASIHQNWLDSCPLPPPVTLALDMSYSVCVLKAVLPIL